MTSKVLLVEEDQARAERITEALHGCGIDAFQTAGVKEAEEALAVRQFDVVLLSSRTTAPEMMRELQAVTRRLCPSAKFFIWGECESGICDAVLPTSVEDADLGRELTLAYAGSQVTLEKTASHLPKFDLRAFEEQMGGDSELMREIIGIYFDESAGQMRELAEALDRAENTRASRLAHSLKGSLGSLHAARARHWAQMLESAAAAGDMERSRTAFAALRDAIDEVAPDLRKVLA
jgi:HPt (histidine-containing phosphotransfer) domain-containing protein